MSSRPTAEQVRADKANMPILMQQLREFEKDKIDSRLNTKYTNKKLCVGVGTVFLFLFVPILSLTAYFAHSYLAFFLDLLFIIGAFLLWFIAIPKELSNYNDDTSNMTNLLNDVSNPTSPEEQARYLELKEAINNISERIKAYPELYETVDIVPVNEYLDSLEAKTIVTNIDNLENKHMQEIGAIAAGLVLIVLMVSFIFQVVLEANVDKKGEQYLIPRSFLSSIKYCALLIILPVVYLWPIVSFISTKHKTEMEEHIAIQDKVREYQHIKEYLVK